MVLLAVLEAVRLTVMLLRDGSSESAQKEEESGRKGTEISVQITSDNCEGDQRKREILLTNAVKEDVNLRTRRQNWLARAAVVHHSLQHTSCGGQRGGNLRNALVGRRSGDAAATQPRQRLKKRTLLVQ